MEYEQKTVAKPITTVVYENQHVLTLSDRELLILAACIKDYKYPPGFFHEIYKKASEVSYETDIDLSVFVNHSTHPMTVLNENQT